MNKGGEIIVVEDDLDDRMIMQQVFTELEVKNAVTFLPDGAAAYRYFNDMDMDPFLIISDINMPFMSGIELRDKMQQTGELRLRSVPFLFLTTSAPQDNIISAYARSVQGFFTKPARYAELKEMIRSIVNYWSTCTEPQFQPAL